MPRFSLMSLLIVMTVVAVLSAVLLAMPDWVAIPAAMLLIVGIPPMLIVAIIRGGRDLRAFAIGGLYPAALLSILMLPAFFQSQSVLNDRNGEPVKWGLALAVVAGGFIGALCFGLGRYLDRRRRG